MKYPLSIIKRLVQGAKKLDDDKLLILLGSIMLAASNYIDKVKSFLSKNNI